jgi:B12-binding domain/radical SAM domain protein
MPSPDLVLLHAPAQMDFRERPYRHWIMCNTVATSPVFEYYPLGFLTLMEYLERFGFEVRIINMAVKMTKSRRFQPASLIAKLRPLAFGIDLHWAPHSAGALELAALCKQIHPDIPVILGGLTASFFHEEAIRDPNVDFVMRGDSTEEPMVELMRCLKERRSPAEVPNLTWKENGEARVNPLSYQPEKLDIKVDFGLLRRHMLRYRDFRGNLFTGFQWPAYCFNMSLWCRGCKYRCITCGGNNWALKRQKLAMRDPEAVAQELYEMQSRTPHHVGAPSDFRMGDWQTLFAALKKKKLPRAPGMEMFTTGDEDFLREVIALGPKAEIALTPESHDEAIRRAYGRPFTNAALEENITSFIDLGGKVRLFFMVGLPGQTAESVRQTVKYCEQLFDRYSAHPTQLDITIAMLAPFIDPGSIAFCDPEAHGYRLFTRTLADHRAAMRQLHWKDVMGYETTAMCRSELVDMGIEASERLCRLRQLFGSLKPKHAADFMRDLDTCRTPKAEESE